MSTDDIHPDEDEIKPFVAVGPSEEYSITVHKQTFDTGFIIVTIIFILIIVTVLIVCIFFSFKEIEITTTEPLPTNTNLTTTTTNPSVSNIQSCLEIKNSVWVNDHCECKYPYTGSSCNLERHDTKFKEIGIPNEEKIGITVIDDIISDGKSFNTNGNKNSCSNYCLNHDDCIGFIYRNPGLCTLLSNNVTVSGNDNISYDPDVDSTLYLKSMDNLKFDGRIFLAEFPHNFPPRYWLVKESYHFVQLFPRELVELKFYPNYINNDGCYVGVYCLFPFSINDIPTLLTYGDSDKCYIHRPRTTLIVPDHWRYHLPIYVMYLPA